MAILAAIDETERSRLVLETAHDLAEKYNETLIVLHVVPEENYNRHRELVQKMPEFDDFSLSQEEESAERFVMKFVEETLGGQPENMEPRGRVGSVTDEILAEVDRVDPRFLVISGRRRSPAGKAIFGDIAQSILLNADCPIVTQLVD
ncbi:universal stress protein [Halobellus sp. GM3]|uniref:universal stress protein n=1 Tax=Halobellus sp. GM3 TaxID=3458410 RepID=UPI00403D9081